MISQHRSDGSAEASPASVRGKFNKREKKSCGYASGEPEGFRLGRVGNLREH